MPYQNQACDTAYHFACTALQKGHEIMQIFFYQDGVYNASSLSVPPQDERHIIQRWSEFNQQTSCCLSLCTASAIRRGIINEKEAKRYDMIGDNLAHGFKLGSLSQFIDALVDADRLIAFKN